MVHLPPPKKKGGDGTKKPSATFENPGHHVVFLECPYLLHEMGIAWYFLTPRCDCFGRKARKGSVLATRKEVLIT